MGSTGRDYEGTVDPGSLDEIFQLLANQTRRELLVYLGNRDGSVELEELVEYLSTAVDWGDSPLEPTKSDDIAIRLHHMHLPKLADFEIVDYDRPDGVVRYRENPVVEEVLKVVVESERISQ